MKKIFITLMSSLFMMGAVITATSAPAQASREECLETLQFVPIKAPTPPYNQPGWSMFWGSLPSTNNTIAETYELTLTAEQLEQCTDEVVSYTNLALWNHEPRNPDYPPQEPAYGWTCPEIRADGHCWKWSVKVNGDVPYTLQNKNNLIEQKPQRCQTTSQNESEGKFSFNVTPGWRNKFPDWSQYYRDDPGPARCWMEFNVLFPDEFGSHTMIVDGTRNNALTPGDVEGKTTAITVDIEEEGAAPTPTPTPTSTGTPTPTPTPTPDDPIDIDYSNNDWGEVDVFTAKKKTVRIQNLSSTPVDVNKIRIKYDNEDQWVKVSEDAGCERLAWPNSCEVKVQFFPRNEGLQAAVLDFDLDADYELEIPLTGVGVDNTPPDAKPDKDEEPEEIKPPDTPGQEVEQISKGKYEVETNKKNVKIKFQPPAGADMAVVGYEWRKKQKPKGKWTKWKFIDPEPNKKGWIKFKVPVKPCKCYKVQLRSITLRGTSPKEQITICTELKPIKGNG